MIFYLDIGATTTYFLLHQEMGESPRRKKNSNEIVDYWISYVVCVKVSQQDQLMVTGRSEVHETRCFQIPQNSENNRIARKSWCNHELTDIMEYIGDILTNNSKIG